MDELLFSWLREERLDAPGGIGTLGEKTQHALLKRYLEPNSLCYEARIGPYVADIAKNGCITEIQSRGFSAMKKKLEYFLQEWDVTVVYPVAQVKWLCWVDPETGAISPRRRSPQRGRAMDLFGELVCIKPLLRRPNLHFRVLLLEVEEYRLKNGWSADGKKGSTRYERIPLGVAEEVYIGGPHDYRRLIPADLPEVFSSRDFSRCGAVSLSFAQAALNVLRHVGAVEQTGKRGNLLLYRLSPALQLS